MILVTGATGFLGSSVCEYLDLTGRQYKGTSKSLGVDLCDYKQTRDFLVSEGISVVFNCAAYVGGIQFGLQREADIFSNNMLMTVNLLRACQESGVKKIVNPISNCAYPGELSLFKEEDFWSGALHPSVLVYGMCRKMAVIGSHAFRRQYGLSCTNIILSNMYGPRDHFDPERSHALGALVHKIASAKINGEKQVVVWGSGTPIREWLYVDDGAKAVCLGEQIDTDDEIINIGCSSGVSIISLAESIASEIGYEGELLLDKSKPDGAPHKTVDGTRGAKLMGWQPGTTLQHGIRETINWYLNSRGIAL